MASARPEGFVLGVGGLGESRVWKLELLAELSTALLYLADSGSETAEPCWGEDKRSTWNPSRVAPSGPLLPLGRRDLMKTDRPWGTERDGI